MRTITKCIVMCALGIVVVPPYQTQALAGLNSAIRTPQTPITSGFSKDEVTELQKRLDLSGETAIKFENEPAAPLGINEAHVKFVKRYTEASGDSPEPNRLSNDYVMSVRITLSNVSSSEVKGVLLEASSNAVAFYLYRAKIAISAGKAYRVVIDLMLMPADPSALVVKLAGAQLDQDVIWGSFPTTSNNSLPQPKLRPASSQARDTVQVDPQLEIKPPSIPVPAPRSSAAASVDSKPVPLNAPQPRYTELARKNGVMGSITARILIGADGSVKKVTVIHPLPDFLTEMAINAAYELKFKPAMKNGQAVAFIVPVVIDFNLR